MVAMWGLAEERYTGKVGDQRGEIRESHGLRRCGLALIELVR